MCLFTLWIGNKHTFYDFCGTVKANQRFNAIIKLLVVWQFVGQFIWTQIKPNKASLVSSETIWHAKHSEQANNFYESLYLTTETTDTETVTDIAEEEVEDALSKCEIFWSAMHKDFFTRLILKFHSSQREALKKLTKTFHPQIRDWERETAM